MFNIKQLKVYILNMKVFKINLFSLSQSNLARFRHMVIIRGKYI